tara:strand:+ start:533 stop:907 length:375 start_codon:yes stop_codon:yes gene_type:complete
MNSHKEITAKAEALRRQLHIKLGVQAQDLEQALRKAGRRLPRRVRGQGARLVAAQKMAGNPKLARQMDGPALSRAYTAVHDHLKAIDVADRRRGMLLSLAAAIALNILVVSGAFLVWLWWRGYV